MKTKKNKRVIPLLCALLLCFGLAVCLIPKDGGKASAATVNNTAMEFTLSNSYATGSGASVSAATASNDRVILDFWTANDEHFNVVTTAGVTMFTNAYWQTMGEGAFALPVYRQTFYIPSTFSVLLPDGASDKINAAKSAEYPTGIKQVDFSMTYIHGFSFPSYGSRISVNSPLFSSFEVVSTTVEHTRYFVEVAMPTETLVAPRSMELSELENEPLRFSNFMNGNQSALAYGGFEIMRNTLTHNGGTIDIYTFGFRGTLVFELSEMAYTAHCTETKHKGGLLFRGMPLYPVKDSKLVLDSNGVFVLPPMATEMELPVMYFTRTESQAVPFPDKNTIDDLGEGGNINGGKQLPGNPLTDWIWDGAKVAGEYVGKIIADGANAIDDWFDSLPLPSLPSTEGSGCATAAADCKGNIILLGGLILAGFVLLIVARIVKK